MREIFLLLPPLLLIFLSKVLVVSGTFNFLTNIFTEITGLEFTDDNDDGPVSSHPNYADYAYSSSYSPYPAMQSYLFGQNLEPYSSERATTSYKYPFYQNPYFNPYFYQFPYPYPRFPYPPRKGYKFLPKKTHILPYNFYKYGFPRYAPYKCKFNSYYGGPPPFMSPSYKYQ